ILYFVPSHGSQIMMLFVLKSYKIRLKKKGKLSPASVNAHLTAIDHYFQFLGIHRIPEIPREDLPQVAPRALNTREQKRFLRAVAGCRRSKDRAVALLMFYTGIRIGECADLDIDDLFVVGRKRKVVIRSGKGERYREIPLNEDVCDAVRDGLRDRAIKYGVKETDEAVFLNPQGGRMSTTGLDLIVRKIGEACGIALSAHILHPLHF
ncbi:MAG: tyrosine-type recombinase/integrase, partial [Candidatus Obscuribacterales bacterium]|nr:tyrosine-type recombinase/integrase [Candidatus Obscuribacterales bacterium]